MLSPVGLFGAVLPPSDLRIGRRLGLQVFQLDVEWPRLQPKGRTYRWDPANFESYDRCVDQLLEQEFEPQICLSDGELPGSLKRTGVGLLEIQRSVSSIMPMVSVGG